MRLDITLKQHTPLIHFQHDQTGATLRATELKPKLDKYLKKLINQNNDYKTRYPGRLRYQVHIVVSKNNSPQDPHSLFFGNQGHNVKYKKTILSTNGKVQLKINTYFDSTLKCLLKKAIPMCFAHENFGTRQNKGFGSFYPDPDTDRNSEMLTIEDVLKKSPMKVYWFDIKGYPQQFNAIEALYRAMKPGINDVKKENNNSAYLKSLLWQYFKDKINSSVIWEKRFIKKELQEKESAKDDNASYLRALLGLTDTFSFMLPEENEESGLTIRMDEDYNDSSNFTLTETKRITVLDENRRNSNDESGIHRFKSPITFKPVKDKVYILLDENAYGLENKSNIKGGKFKFSGKGINTKTLEVPSDFSLEDFLDYVMEKINEDNCFPGFEGGSAQILKKMELQKL